MAYSFLQISQKGSKIFFYFQSTVMTLENVSKLPYSQMSK